MPKEEIFFGSKNGICPNKNNCGIMDSDNIWISGTIWALDERPSIKLSDGSDINDPKNKPKVCIRKFYINDSNNH